MEGGGWKKQDYSLNVNARHKERTLESKRKRFSTVKYIEEIAV